ncbi:hypothetical protein [Pseudomonas putida]|uniref:Uncharacterized protein n=1 Tax=Pseudomonas putida TaxID=303 RepID=A0A1B2F699_PSEPU|nr:hypothetical protein [Pseudomonas putida]ANY87674.1 hypothetical protein IEC33019_2117 [Pseudomonas putida]
MDTNKMREQFEAWALRAKAHGEHFDLSRGNHGAYKSPITHWLYCSWVASWQASREAVVVELPEKDGPFTTNGVEYYSLHSEGRNQAIDEISSALVAQGLKVAP